MTMSLTDEIAQRAETDSGRFYFKMEQLFSLLGKWFSYLLFVSTLTLIVPPICFTFYDLWQNDNMTKDMWELPMKITLPFEINSVPIYLVVLFVSSISIWSMTICKTMTAEIFYRFGLHLLARCQDMELLLENIGNLYKMLSSENVEIDTYLNLYLFSVLFRNNKKKIKDFGGKLRVELIEVISLHGKMLE
ncbi:uncharacterized protein LOC129574677 [Sitodiplosis mosellana]|uniref:uncharacterized protein LOC129574677 n=1 Tax=Sitodiplosis mosellana TaxID=263140 RepID=UPI0024448D50|nr:uncharacterized protein LOC129574677 [Sitodiplosis mosellana]